MGKSRLSASVTSNLQDNYSIFKDCLHKPQKNHWWDENVAWKRRNTNPTALGPTRPVKLPFSVHYQSVTVCTCVFMPTCGRYFVLSLHAAFLHLSSVRHCENTSWFCNITTDRTEDFQRRSICPLVSIQDKQTHKIVTDILACHASPDVLILARCKWPQQCTWQSINQSQIGIFFADGAILSQQHHNTFELKDIQAACSFGIETVDNHYFGSALSSWHQHKT